MGRAPAPCSSAALGTAVAQQPRRSPSAKSSIDYVQESLQSNLALQSESLEVERNLAALDAARGALLSRGGIRRALLARRRRPRDRCAARHAAESRLLHRSTSCSPPGTAGAVPDDQPIRRSSSSASANRTRASRCASRCTRRRFPRRSARSARCSKPRSSAASRSRAG